MRDIVKEAQAIIDEFILASTQTTREVQMKKYKKNRKKKLWFCSVLCFIVLLTLFLYIGIGRYS